jgi:hypothetical protein
MFNRFRLGALLLICLVVPFFGCGSATEIDSITVTPAAVNFGGLGLTAQLSATGTINHGTHPATTVDVTDQVTWSTGSNDVATVSASGLVTSTGPGSIQITASMNGFTGLLSSSSTVTVTTTSPTGNQEPYAKLSISPSSQSVATAGETGQFIAIATSGITGLQSNVTDSVAWSSSSPSVATISKTGLATAASGGSTTITAIATNPDGTVVTAFATFTVTSTTSTTAEPVVSLTIVPNAQTVPAPGSTGQFVALATSGITGLQTNATSTVVWSSSNVGVATIGANTGLATATGQGTTVILAIATNPDGSVVTGTATFTVTGPSAQQITSLAIIPGSQTVTLPLVASTTPTTFFVAIGTNGSTGLNVNETNAVAWTSSDTAVATINTSGGVTPLSQGTTTITAQYTNPATGSTPTNVVTATATLTVSGIASEPLLSIQVLPASQSISYPGQTSQLTAIGTFSQTPVTQNLTSSTTYPLTWISSDTSVATVCTIGSPAPCTSSTYGLVTAVGQGTAAITAIAKNADGSVVTGVATITVTNGVAEQITALSIIPSSLSLSATGQPGQFIAIGTSGLTGLNEDVTNSPQLAWSSSIPTYATIATYPAANAGQAQGVSAGTTNITAEWTNPATATTPVNVVTATASVNVTTTPAAEPLLSISVIPSSITDLDLLGTGQFLAYGTFSTAPTVLEITNGFSHVGFPASCTVAPCPVQPVTWVSSAQEIFPIDSAGATGATGGLATADGSGNADIYAVATNPDGTLVYSPIVTFNCPYAPPTYTTITDPITGVSTTTMTNPGTCNEYTIGDSLLSTLTVFNTGLNTTNWLITAPSATGTADVIHCGGTTEQATQEGSVCTATYPNGTTVIVTAPAEAGVNFGGWSDTCTSINPNPSTAAGPNTCTVQVGGGCVFNPITASYTCSNQSNVSVGAIFN